jgi:predicted glycosyltransferase
MDEKVSFDWLGDESVVVNPVSAIAVYTNTHGEVVIRQQNLNESLDQDPLIVIPRERVRDVIAALKKESEG